MTGGRWLELDPSYDEPHLHLGIIWLDQQRYTQAQSEFEAVERLNAKSSNEFARISASALLFQHFRNSL